MKPQINKETSFIAWIAIMLLVAYNMGVSQTSVDYFTEMTLEGHTESVTSLAFTPDGGILASGSNDKTVRFWNPDTGQLIRTLSDHNDEVKSVAFSPNGRILVSVTWNGFIRFWNVQTGELIRTLEHKVPYRTTYGLSTKNGILWTVAVAPDGRSMATGGQYQKSASASIWNGKTWSGTIRLWNKKGESLKNLEWHTDAVYSVMFSPDGKFFASGSADKTIQFCDAQTGEWLKTLNGHQDSVLSLAFSPDGKILASGSADRTIKLWDVESGNLLKTLEGHEDSVLSVSFSRYGKTLASGSRDSTVKIWDVQTGKLLTTLEGHKDSVTEVDFSPNNDILASGSVDKTVKIWHIK
jgi:WD40 repeat protein